MESRALRGEISLTFASEEGLAELLVDFLLDEREDIGNSHND